MPEPRWSHITPSNRLLVIHHTDHDGFGAAMVAYLALGRERVELWPTGHKDAPPDVRGRDVLIVDFCYPRELLVDTLYPKARSLRVLDHHKTAAEACGDLEYCTFVEDASACALAWEYFHAGEAVPRWVQLIEDRDLWRMRHGEETLSFHAYLQSIPMTTDAWHYALTRPAAERAQEGHGIRRYQLRQFETIARNGRLDTWPGFNIPRSAWPSAAAPVVVHTATPLHASDVCHLMLAENARADFAMTYYRTAEGLWHHELRSRQNHPPDVGALAKLYSGGGHADAAGFIINSLVLP